MQLTIVLFLSIMFISTPLTIDTQTTSLYAFISTDSPIYLPGQQMVAEIFIYPQENSPIQATIKLYFLDLPNAPSIPDIQVTIPPVSEKRFLLVRSHTITLPQNIGDGTYNLKMEIWVNGVKVIEDTVDFWIRGGPPSGIKPMILFVWHNHQGPNYHPDGGFFANWHIVHFFQDNLQPYFSLDEVYGEPIFPDMGTYYLHYYLLTKYPNIKVNLHYSPSLIYQLELAYEKGFTIYDPSIQKTKNIKPGDPLTNVIHGFFQGLHNLHEEGRVYIMTSVFAHTIMGYYIDRYGIDKLLKYDIELGINTTRELIVDTDAIWTPEMAWSDKLIPIYLDLGLKYTVLDGTHHFPGAQGDKSSIFEPYIIRDQMGRELIVFFRDQRISDGFIGFTNQDWDDPRQADRDARSLYYEIYNTHSFKNYQYQPIHVIAADGENWILFAPSTGNGALFLDRIYRYLDKLTLQGIMESGTFEDAVRVHPPQRILTSIPSTSWLGGWGKWTTERGEEHRIVWDEMSQAIAKYKGYLYYKDITSYEGFRLEIKRNTWFNQTVYDLIHAMDSDFWWAEFFSRTYIEEWLREFDKDFNNIFKIKLSITLEPENPVNEVINKAYVSIINENNYIMRDTKISVKVSNINSTLVEVSIEPGSRHTLTVFFRPRSVDKITLFINIYNPGSIVAGKLYYLYSREYRYNVYQPVDLEVSVFVKAPDGSRAGLSPTPPGEYVFTITALTSNKQPVEYDVPITIILYIAGKEIVKNATIYKGEHSTTQIIKIDLSEGTYIYNVTIRSSYDPELENNIFKGRVTVSQKTSQTKGFDLVTIALYVTITLWIIALILIVIKFVKKK